MKEIVNSSPRFAGMLLAGSLALTGCAKTGNVTLPESQNPNISILNAFVTDGSNFRTDPAKFVDGDGGTNACISDRKNAVVLEDQEGYLSQGIGDDSNGPWIGLKLEGLPEDIKSSCDDDKDGIVWVIKSQLTMSDPVKTVTLQN